jgi:hypothetical protein
VPPCDRRQRHAFVWAPARNNNSANFSQRLLRHTAAAFRASFLARPRRWRQPLPSIAGKRLGGTFTEDLKPQTPNFKCSLAEQRSKTELIGNRLGKFYRRATRLHPRMEGRGRRGSGGCTLRPAIHPPRDKFARRPMQELATYHGRFESVLIELPYTIQSCSNARMRPTTETKNAVDQPSSMTPFAPSMAPRMRQIRGSVISP